MTEDEIIQKLYSGFGTNGILFGIKDKDAVRLIIRFTMNSSSPSPLWAGDEDMMEAYNAGFGNRNEFWHRFEEWLTNYKKTTHPPQR